MLKKTLSAAVVLVLFVVSTLFLAPHDKTYKVLEIKTPTNLVLENGEFVLDEYDSFDSTFTEHNKMLAKKFNITEIEAFILGNLAKYKFENLLKGRNVYIKDNNDLIYYKYSYKDRFFYSGFCIKDDEPCSQDAFEYQLKSLKRANYKVLDLDTDIVYNLDDDKIRSLV